MQDYPLSIRGTAGITGSLPVTGGIPLAEGEAPAGTTFMLQGESGPKPTQTTVLGTWPDGSARWLLIDAVAPAGEYLLTPGGSSLPLGAIRVVETEIENGEVNLRTDGADLVLAEDASIRFEAVDAHGVTYTATPETVEIEREGPVRSTLSWSGEFLDGGGERLFSFRLRASVYAYSSRVLLQPLILVDPDSGVLCNLRELRLRITLPGTTGAIIGGDPNWTGDTAIPTRLFQRDDEQYDLDGASGGKAPGWAEIQSSMCSVSLAMRDFWQQWPKSLEVDGDDLVLGLLPTFNEGDFAHMLPDYKHQWFFANNTYQLRTGQARSWDIWLAVESDGADLAQLANCPPVLVADPLRATASGVWGEIQPAGSPGMRDYDPWAEQLFHCYCHSVEVQRDYGAMNWGDWFGERQINWGNHEYDTTNQLLLQFARTGDPLFQRRAEEVIRHQRDVDTRHYAKDPRRIGQQWIHSIGHTAGYYDYEYKHMKLYAGRGWSDNRGHVWSQGMFEHYLLGGDTRSWETAKLISDWAAGPQITNFAFGNAREPGWMSKLVMSAYYATEDPFYLNAAKEMLRITHGKSLATGDHGFYYHRLPNGHCNCPDEQKHKGEAGFMLGVLMTGMKMYYDASGDETVADDIAKIGRFIVDTMWDPKEMGFRYTSCPQTNASSGSVWIMLEGLAFGARRRKDAEMAEVCRLALSQGWQALTSSGKGSGYVLCNSAPGLEQLTRLPGPNFGEYRREREKVLLTPARRPVPLLVANPDFEEDITGWPSRGWNVERCMEVKHGGEASLKISGAVSGQNEFVNTRYDAATSPMEIRWLKPGGKYEFSAWLRIDRLPKGAPAPDLRVAFRDANGTRGGKGTNDYDLAKMGTWQRLSVVFEVPEWNTRNYLALSTKSRD
ncbi:MAG: hypothetical protein HN380_27200, partial [Victivallales bacterium]|nr:hypothetical protein [Victivallales bacterium]